MPNAVYHRFTPNDRFETRVMTWPSIVWWSGTGGARANLDMPSGSLSLYGGVRARFDVGISGSAGVHVYPLDEVDTHSIDKVIQISGSYPATGTINLVRCTNEDLERINQYRNGVALPTTTATDDRWFDEHYRPIELLAGFHDLYNTAYEFHTGSYPEIYLFHVPSMYYDRQISTGTVRITDWTNDTGSQPFVFIDDGYGQLLRSGTREQWGMVFYVEGLVVMTPSGSRSGTFTFNYTNAAGTGSLNTTAYRLGHGTGTLTGSDGRKLQFEFSGSHPIITKTFMCRIHESECNCSRNPTWSVDVSGTRMRSGTVNTTYISQVGLFNEDYELVAVAKMAQPIRKREQDRLDIRLRMDF